MSMLAGLEKRVEEDFIGMTSREEFSMKFVKFNEGDGVGWLTICRSEVLNALNKDVLEELESIINKLKSSVSLRVLVITGDGKKAFVAGADIASMQSMTAKDALEFAAIGQSVLNKIDKFPKPVIAAVNGFALGGGCELALACDFIVASENAKFGQPEVKLGIIPGFGGTQRLPREIGMRKAKELIFSGRMIDAQEAFRIGLVNKVVPSDSLQSEVNAIAKEISLQGPFAVSISKKAINDGVNTDLESALLIERQSFALCFDTNDQKEGCSAFVEKRRPNFTGS